jgi:Tol biopolymer transport system component
MRDFLGKTALVSAAILAASFGASALEGPYHHMPTGITADGQQILFQSWEKQASGKSVAQLFSIKPDGTGLKRALQVGISEGWPSFTKDGKRAVLFARLKAGGDAELLVLDLATPNEIGDFSKVTRLTYGEDADFFPTWSPDGKQIAFYGHRSGEAQIYVMDADGSNVRNISDNGIWESDPTWSVKGEITFESRLSGNADVWIMRGDGSGRVNLTEHASEDHFGDWSPDGEKIVFSSNRSGKEQLYIMKRDGSDVTRLTHSEYTDRWPRWSPDGSYIVFDRNDGDKGSNVVLIKPDGSGERQLTEDRSYHIK